MKQWRMYIGIGLAVLALVGIGWFGSQKYEGKESLAAAPEVVSLWHTLQGEQEQALLQCLREITDQHPEVLVQGFYVTEQDLVQETVLLQAAGKGPDIFVTTAEGFVSLFQQGALAPVAAEKGETAESLLEAEGVCYALRGGAWAVGNSSVKTVAAREASFRMVEEALLAVARQEPEEEKEGVES